MLTLPTAVLGWPGQDWEWSASSRAVLCHLPGQSAASAVVHAHTCPFMSFVSVSYLVSAAAPAPAQQQRSSFLFFSPPPQLQSSLNTQTHTHTLGARSNEFQAPRGHMLCSLRDGESFPQLPSCSSSCSVLSSWLRLPRCIHSWLPARWPVCCVTHLGANYGTFQIHSSQVHWKKEEGKFCWIKYIKLNIYLFNFNYLLTKIIIIIISILNRKEKIRRKKL